MTEIFNEWLSTILLGIISLTAAYAGLYLRKATAKVKSEIDSVSDETQRRLLSSALFELDDIATKTVQALEQTMAGELRQAVKSGNASRDALLQLSATATAKVYERMKPSYLACLKQNMAQLDGYVKDTIESKVLEAKGMALPFPYMGGDVGNEEDYANSLFALLNSPTNM